LIERAVREVINVARARKVALADDEAERTMKTSMAAGSHEAKACSST